MRKEGNESRCFSPERGWEAKISQTQKLQLEGGEIWGWDWVGWEKMGLNWGRRRENTRKPLERVRVTEMRVCNLSGGSGGT